jgi:DNA polymerase
MEITMPVLSARPEDYCFFDFETRALPGSDPIAGDLPKAGTHRYSKVARPVLLTYAIGSGPVQCVSFRIDGFRPDDGLLEGQLPPDLLMFAKLAQHGEKWMVAWKTSFDRTIWNAAGFPHLEPEMTLDAMVQALASNLPGDLQTASVVLGGPGKQTDGKKLIQLFAPANGATPQSHPEEWARYKSYATRDTAVLRDVFWQTRHLSRDEWEEYWAAEHINERGVMVDTEFCDKADGLAQASIGWANNQMRKLTGRATMKVSTVQQIARWAYDKLSDPEARAILEEEIEDDDDEEEIDFDPQEVAVAKKPKEIKLRLTRAHIVRIRALLAQKRATDTLTLDDAAVDQILELREYGGAASIAKFAKMRDQADDGRIKDSYVFNGAMQTGRFSSRGIQVHNLPRDSLGLMEEAAIGDVLAMQGNFDSHVDRFAHDYGPVGRTLSRLIRPALCAPKGKTLVWGDWSNIEARVNPWLSLTRSGDEKLGVFRKADANPDDPDVYMHTAADLLHIRPDQVTKAERQSHGKVPELSLGFGGGKDALLRMAATYGVSMTDENAAWMVEMWREKNPWARHFWDALWDAIRHAVEAPGAIFKAGRVSYVYLPSYLGGSLFCALPDGRLLTYPKCRWEEREVENRTTKEKYMRWQLTYGKGRGRAVLWYGKACENVTQATAGSLLRRKLWRLEDSALDVVLHTHDDICVEVAEEHAAFAAEILAAKMKEPEDWCESLPLAVETKSNWFFTKALD